MSLSNRLQEPLVSLWRKLLDKLALKNGSLIKDLGLNQGHEWHDKVATIDWENRFLPLTYFEAKQCWSEVKIEESSYKSLTLLDALCFLADRSRIVWGDIVGKQPSAIYPTTFFTMVSAHEQHVNV